MTPLNELLGLVVGGAIFLSLIAYIYECGHRRHVNEPDPIEPVDRVRR